MNKQARKQAIRYLSEQRKCSYSVASHILDCMGTKQRKRFLDKFRNKGD